MGDRDGKVREGATSSLNGFMLHVGYPKMAKLAGDNKKIRDELDKVKELLPKVEAKVEVIDMVSAMGGTKSSTKSNAKDNISKVVESESSVADPDTESAKAFKKPTQKPVAKKGKTVKGKPVVEEDLGEIIIGNDKLKAQREKDDNKLKTLKWTFDVGVMPRDELVEQLKTQCVGAFGTKFLEFFHKSDGPSQMKAIGLLGKKFERYRDVDFFYFS